MKHPLYPEFFAQVKRNWLTGCWEWQGYLLPNGYGQHTKQIMGTQLAHRISYMIAGGDLVAGMEIDHLCLNRRCVNPKHLEQVTKRENNKRRRATHCKRGHEYAKTGFRRVVTASGTIKSTACHQCRRDHYHASKAVAA